MHRIDTVDSVAGAFSDGNQVAGTPGTPLDAAWLNAAQEELASFIEAQGIALVKGTNTQLAAALVAWLQNNAHTFGALHTLNGAAGDTNAALTLGGTPSTRKLKTILKGDGINARIYSGVDGELEIVLNAAWTGTQWASDQTGAATKIELRFGAIMFSTYTSVGAAWADSAWVPRMDLSTDRGLALKGVTTGAGGGNPPAATAIANELRAKNVCKAWATIDHWALTLSPSRAESITLEDGFNVASCARDTANTIKVTFAQAMKDAKYAVLANVMEGADTSDVVYSTTTLYVLERTSTYFRLQGGISAEGNVAFSVLVFGVQDS